MFKKFILIKKNQPGYQVKKSMFSMRFTIAVFIIFFINICAGMLHMEPYPTLLLPSGAGKLTKDENNNVQFESKALCAMNRNNEWVDVDIDKLGQKMPAPLASLYLSVLNFGFYDQRPKFYAIKDMLHIGKSETQRQADYKDFLRWLGSRLEEQGLKSDSVKTRLIVWTFSLETHRIVQQKIVNESTHQLR